MNREMEAVLEVTAIEESDFVGKCRKRDLVMARTIYAHMRHELGVAVMQIAREINREHTSIIYYLKAYANDIMYDKGFRALVDKINIRYGEGTEQQGQDSH